MTDATMPAPQHDGAEVIAKVVSAETLPELGTAEAALRSCVNLISRATGQPEELLAYWLDLYYQVRRMADQPKLEDLIAPPLSRERPAASRPPPKKGRLARASVAEEVPASRGSSL